LEDLTIADSGTYVFTTAEGCQISLEVSVTEVSGPEVELDLENILIYPNPITQSRLNFFLRDFMNEEVIVRIYDLNGSRVYEKLITVNHAEIESIEVFYLQTGVYVVELEHKKSDQSLLKKIIKS
jgi:hypothetical protein